MEPISEYFRNALAESIAQKFEVIFRESRSRKRLWPVWHRTCTDICFFMLKDPHLAAINSPDVVLFNGDPPEANSPMICESCHQTILKIDLLADPPPVEKTIYVGAQYS